jgi:putative tricarboxylic transport membrane protein
MGKRRVVSILLAVALCFTALIAAAGAQAQSAWRPERAVEIITSSDAGGSNDRVARVMQKIIQDDKLVSSPIVVVNKPGGNQTLAVAYLNQHAGDAHYLLLANPTVFGNEIAGITPQKYTDLSLVVNLLTEHTVFTVRNDSPFKSMRDLFDKLKADPAAISIGIVSLGGPNHLTLCSAVKAAGIDARKLKTPVFKTNADSMTAVLGGHLQLVASSVSAVIEQVKAGNARMLAIAAPKRMSGALANVPTLRELGYEVELSSWRAVFGARGFTPAQIAFWEEVFAKMSTTDAWKKDLANNDWAPSFMRSREGVKYMATEYNVTRAVMTDLGLAK